MPLSLYTYYTERELLSCDNLFPIRLLYNMQINMFKQKKKHTTKMLSKDSLLWIGGMTFIV